MAEPDSRRERKKHETHQRLLEAAWCLFRERGYEETTVADIAEAADVGKGTFFNYFPTKEALVNQVSLWRIEALGEQVLTEEGAPQRAVERIKALMTAMAEEFRPEQGLARPMFMARVSAPLQRESAHRMGSLVQELVVYGQANGEIRGDVDPGLVSRLLMTCWFHHLMRWWHEGGDFPEEAKLLRAVDMLMEGMGTVKGRST